jgi:hypothetical protein
LLNSEIIQGNRVNRLPVLGSLSRRHLARWNTAIDHHKDTKTRSFNSKSAAAPSLGHGLSSIFVSSCRRGEIWRSATRRMACPARSGLTRGPRRGRSPLFIRLPCENISSTLVRTISGGGIRSSQSRPWVGFEPDAGKRILARRKNENHGGPRRGVDESGVATVQTVAVHNQSKLQPKYWNRRDRQFNVRRSPHSNQDQSTTPDPDCRISTRGGRDPEEISVLLRDSRSSSVVKSYRSANEHRRLPGTPSNQFNLNQQRAIAPIASSRRSGPTYPSQTSRPKRSGSIIPPSK